MIGCSCKNLSLMMECEGPQEAGRDWAPSAELVNWGH